MGFEAVLVAGAAWVSWAPVRVRELGLALLAFGLVCALTHSVLAGLAYFAMGAVVWALICRGKPLPLPAAVVVIALSAGLVMGEWREAFSNGSWHTPLGMSYIVFRLIHVVVDARRGAWTTPPKAAEFAHFLFSPALLVAGPLERWAHWENRPQDTHGRMIATGVWRGVTGFLKKLYLADFLLPWLASQTAWTTPDLIGEGSRATELWQASFFAYLKIYLEFSAYCDIAVGVGLLWGRRPMENFNWPVIASTPADFWRRWHISLSQWCANCIYLPVMGRLRGVLVPMLASFIVMGLWHGLGWNRVGWAVWQVAGLFVFIIWQRRLGRIRPDSWRAGWVWRLASIGLTQAFVVASYVFMLQGETVPLLDSLNRLARMLGWPP